MAMDVCSKTAIITGAGSGINLSFARLLLSQGCNVLIADLKLRPESEILLTEFPLTSSTGPRCHFQETDVTEWKQLDRMFAVAIEKFGGVDIVCPGAGVYEPLWSNFWVPPGTLPSQDDPSESRYATLDINVVHPIRVTQLAISHFLSHKKSGCIVLVSSVAGQVPYFPTPIYVASKYALNGFVRSLYRLESPPEGTNLPKIRVNAVAPARIFTPLWTEQEDKLRMIGKQPGFVSPDEVARVMLELVTKDKYVGGSIVEVGDRVRVVQTFNDGGPNAEGNEVGYSELEEEDMWASLQRQYGV